MWITVFIYGLSVLIATAAVCYRWIRRKDLAAVANMSSGPPTLPLLGHLYLLKFTSPENLYSHLTNIANSYPSPMALHMGPYIHVVVSKPEDLQAVMTSPHCLSKSMHYEFFRVSRGLFSAPAHVWKGQRKILNLSFGPGILSSFLSIFNEKSAILATVLGHHVGKKERDFSREISKWALDTIFSTAFSQDYDLQRTPDGDLYLDLQEEFIELVMKRIFSASYYFEWIYRLSKDYKREQDILRYARVITKRVLEEQNAEAVLADKTKTINPVESSIEGKKPQIFLDKLLELARDNHLLNREDIPEHLDTIIFAGNDTTATTMTALLLMLAMYPDVQERVYQEVMEVCPDKDHFVTIEDTAKLTYTEMVCKETMRLFPVGPVIGRSAGQDIKLDDHNTIPANSTAVCAIYQVQRDPKIWGSKANEFDPDHFLPENFSKIHPYAYLPFSGGARNCIGIRYAWISMKIMIVHILRKYRLKTSLTMNQLSLRFCMILKISNGCLFSLEGR